MALVCMTGDFNQVLSDWLEFNDQKDADNLSKAQKIPAMFQKGTTLYRGMTVNDDFLNKLKDGKIKFDKLTSWTSDKKLAIKFASDPKYRLGDKNGKKIIITKKIPSSNVILDIYNYCLFVGDFGFDELAYDSAMNEKEVLVKKNIKIDIKDVEFI